MKVKIILTMVNDGYRKIMEQKPKVTGKMVVWQCQCLRQGDQEEDCGRGKI